MAQRFNPDTGEYEDFGMGSQPDSIQRDQRNDNAQTPALASTQHSDADVEARLRAEAKSRGVTYDDSDLQDVRHRDNSDDAMAMAMRKFDARAHNTPNQDGGGNGGGSLSAAYGGYLGGNSQPQGSDLLSYLKEQQTRQDQERAAMRGILMKGIGDASAPVSVDSPGIKELIAARKLESQRGSERERASMAERLAAQGLGDSGALDSGVAGIEQNRTEADASATAGILNQELQGKRDQLRSLMAMAVQSGDAESARTLQAQLEAIDQQMQDRHFNADLGFRQSSFMDDLGMRLLALQLGANRDAASAFM